MKLGIVTISFNQAQYLTECIESVQLKDRGKLRYVIVDPGSTDGSRQLILSHQDRFSTIVLEPDQGPADGLNKGFARCDADIYGYLNSDDRFRPGALDYVLSYFENHPETDILLGAIATIDGNGRTRLRKRTQDRPFDNRKFAVCACNVFQQGTFFLPRSLSPHSRLQSQKQDCLGQRTGGGHGARRLHLRLHRQGARRFPDPSPIDHRVETHVEWAARRSPASAE